MNFAIVLDCSIHAITANLRVPHSRRDPCKPMPGW
jgi:hypothetical protein